MSQLERRTFPVEDAEVEVRQSEDGEDEFVLKGHAAVFNSRSKPLGPPGHKFVEEIEPGAFSSALEDSDIRALFNHDPNELLARESAGTLDVAEDDEGLRYEARLGDDPKAEFVQKKVERGEITGNSFSFAVSEENESWNHDPADSDLPVRTIHEFDRVDDLGPVAFAAYPQATVSDRVEQRAQELNADQQQDADPLTVKLNLDLDTDLMPEPDPQFAERDKQWMGFLRNHLGETRQSRPDFDGTEDISPEWADGEWGRPALSDHPEADEGDDFEDLSESDQNAIRGRFIEQSGENYSDLGFPVVNPQTGRLNRNGVLAARQRGDGSEAGDIADDLWEEHFAEDEDEENSRDLRRKRLGLIG